MRHNGNTRSFNKELGFDIIRAYHHLVKSSSAHLSSKRKIFKALVHQPSRRYWVSDERALEVVKQMLAGKGIDGMQPNKRNMFRDIYHAVIDMMSRDASLSLAQAVTTVVESPAPKFYMTPGTALVIFYRYRKEWHARQMRRLRFLTALSDDE